MWSRVNYFGVVWLFLYFNTLKMGQLNIQFMNFMKTKSNLTGLLINFVVLLFSNNTAVKINRNFCKYFRRVNRCSILSVVKCNPCNMDRHKLNTSTLKLCRTENISGRDNFPLNPISLIIWLFRVSCLEFVMNQPISLIGSTCW